MHLKPTIILTLFAATTTAQLLGGLLPLSPAPAPSPSSTPFLTPSSSASSSALNPDDYDCIYQNRGCDWTKSKYGYGNDYCGVSPFKPGQTLSDGNVIMAVASNGTSEACTKSASHACCKALDESPCTRGEKYLECYEN
ncbi:uncharacterized protein EURHEDRAFT_272144 [Aspergillus ruber CBS 135680]|uniref:Uncharacterized protein n=1 Tax=Aspergillus ruber (strain CBS 135680) TaxID=1388766 RepID=A0A017SMK1_ASPRC|nr:uncharacterized protein EURHEDRAFT_272144 [Aspergillus ruber CBS 135680]EYE98172.1 hypothetical protein EURHEDRAFT_272144 [Aspergillus ruber CBS 135680]